MRPVSLKALVLSLVFGFAILGCIDQRSPAGSERQAVLRPLSAKERQIVQSAMLSAPPRPRIPLQATLSIPGQGPAVFFYGVDIQPWPLQRGKKATITYYFRPLQRIRDRWGLFLHLQRSAKGNEILSNLDHHPVKGLYHSQRWEVGKIFRSAYEFTFPDDFPGPEAVFYTGLWRGNDRMTFPASVPSDQGGRLLLQGIPVHGRELERPIYLAYQVTTPPVIDGLLNDEAWRGIPSTGPFRTPNGRKARFRTEAKIAWDSTYLYAAFDLDDDDIWSTYTKRDDPIFNQEVVEFFIDADRNRQSYVELQVSPAGVIFDSFFDTYRSPKPWGRLSYDSQIEAKVHLRGTLNNPKDVDQGWSVEMRIPFRTLGPAPNLPPKDGDEWAINLYRLERSRRSGGEGQSWSPVTSDQNSDYHRLDRFGTLRFVARTVSPSRPIPRLLPTFRSLQTPPVIRPISPSLQKPASRSASPVPPASPKILPSTLEPTPLLLPRYPIRPTRVFSVQPAKAAQKEKRLAKPLPPAYPPIPIAKLPPPAQFARPRYLLKPSSVACPPTAPASRPASR